MKKTRIVIVGGGFGGINTLKELHKTYHGDTNVEISLVNNTNYFLFTPLLHEVATGGINPGNIVEPIRKVLGCCLKQFVVGEVTRIDTEKQEVHTTHRSLPYDILVLALGSKTVFYGCPGAEEHCYTLKSLDDALALKRRFISQVECAIHEKDEAKRKAMLHFCIIGGGPTGVELAAEAQELFFKTLTSYYPYHKDIISEIRISLIQKGSALLPVLSEKIQQKAFSVLTKKGIDVKLSTGVVGVTKDSVELDSGEKLLTQTPIWVAGVGPQTVAWDKEPELSTRGKILVHPTLQTKSHKNIFVIGDMAHCSITQDGTPLPALAQVAHKEGIAAAKNIHRILSGKKTEPIRYVHSGNLVSLGSWMAAGEIKGRSFSGHLTWWFWRTVYLTKLISWQKKVKVAIDWTVNLLSPRDISHF
ncbi:MAG: NAD(P)/FAD-dependent oxidoreductase [Candidatus Magasanikbacteria bacterium]|jgi:NADH:ubiquinone reductase (H+-translocating)|nr:NAD(P)/FAD-dependent oxidoreductase [Candidatus Magasanikbacteria bacterium]